MKCSLKIRYSNKFHSIKIFKFKNKLHIKLFFNSINYLKLLIKQAIYMNKPLQFKKQYKRLCLFQFKI